MMRYRGRKHARSGERGVTMIIVAVALLSTLAMVALAIDVITLYSARSEAQRAADAAALASAKMLVDAGVTGDPNNLDPALRTAAQAVGITMAQNVAQQASIAGQPVLATDVTVAYPNGAVASFGINPTVTVTVQRTNLPIFFSRIWSRASLTVRASATAEAYNPSNSSSLTAGAGVPIVARCVKPFLLPNCDPGNAGAACGGTGTTFIDPATGAITRPGQTPGGVIGETFNLNSNCTAPGCIPGAPAVNLYYPVQIPPAATGNACPSTCGGGTTFEGDIECCNPTPLACGTTVGPIANTLQLDATVFPEGGGGPAQEGVQCLIHQTPGNGQDTLNGGVFIAGLTYPLQIQAGHNHPLAGTASLAQGDFIATSDSLVTVPIYDPTSLPPQPGAGSPVTIIGFLQLFINRAHPGGGGGPNAGTFQVTVVNVSGCGSGASATPVFTGSSSAVPVRLIHQ
jgi:Flp pilus assembly protein TadG